MEPLFQAKALWAAQYALYDIFRVDRNKYRAQLITDEDGNYDDAAPLELLITKIDGVWQTEDQTYCELAGTIGIEIDAFNNGYGAILGRIGIE